MNSKRHHNNSNFQILYFLIGSCHTPDAAYSLLLDLKEEREMAIEAYEVNKIREKAKRLLAESMISSDDVACRLNGEADLLEINFAAKRGEELYAAAVSELEFIKDCIDKINSNRKYKHLSDDEAHQISQDEEWLYELIYRAENFLATTGTIPTDHFATMRLHPRFVDVILPAIEEFKLAMTSQDTFNKRLISSPYRTKLIT